MTLTKVKGRALVEIEFVVVVNQDKESFLEDSEAIIEDLLQYHVNFDLFRDTEQLVSFDIDEVDEIEN